MKRMNVRTIVCILAALSASLVVGCANQSKMKKLQSKLDECQSARKKLDKKNQKYQSEISSLEDEVETLESEIEQAEELAKERKKLYSELQNKLKSMLKSGRADITFRKGLMIVKMPNDVLFKSGEFGLRDKGKKALAQVASALDDLEDRRILVAGHTDDVPVRKKAKNYSSNLELSAKRAMSAVEVLSKNGVPESDLGALGFGPHDPIVSNEGDQGRAKNRRVELILLPDMSNLLQPIKQAMMKEKSSASDDNSS